MKQQTLNKSIRRILQFSISLLATACSVGGTSAGPGAVASRNPASTSNTTNTVVGSILNPGTSTVVPIPGTTHVKVIQNFRGTSN